MTPLTGLDRTSPTFKTDLDTFFLSSLPQFVTEANALETAVDADRIAAAGSAVTAADSADAAGSHAAASLASSSQAQDSAQVALAILAVNVAPAFVSGQTVAIGDPRYSLVNFQTYRAKTEGAHTTDPSTDSANWASVPASVPEVKTPTNTSPVIAATGITETPTLTASTYGTLYGIAMAASQWQVSTVSNFASTVLDTGDVAGTSTSYTLAGGLLSTNTVYYWRCRYKDALGSYSDWSIATSFTTAATFNAYIATPTATPAAFGDSFEGGFYTGMIWNELVQSTTSTTIGTGSKVFTVADMTASPLVYAGQALEVRSRANPANKMIGTVTGALGTSLTINVTTVGGSGTFADWSIMAQYRVIVAPKSTGENTSIAYKNANTAAPAACSTLTEGRKATLAMVAADTATVYPAAHWCNNLSIAGKTDWYLPARDELELCWRNLKPTADANYTTANRGDSAIDYKNLGAFDDTVITHGTNNNSSPSGAAYTTGVPAQVAAGKNFRTGESEAFVYGSFSYWSASEYSASAAWGQDWHSSVPGSQYNGNKTSAHCVRAVRRSII